MTKLTGKGQAMRQLSSDDSGSELERLYEHHQQPIVRYLMNLVHDQELAADLCQDTFERVLKHLSRQETNSPQTAYYFNNLIYRIAKNRAIDHDRHTKLIDFLPIPGSNAEPSIEGDEDRICDLLWLQEAVEQMPPKYRECLLRKHYWGYSQKEIAAELGITESAVSANISHGKTHLRKKYFPGTDGLKRAAASALVEELIKRMLQYGFSRDAEELRKFGAIQMGNQWYKPGQFRVVDEVMNCLSVATNKIVTIHQPKIFILSPDHESDEYGYYMS